MDELAAPTIYAARYRGKTHGECSWVYCEIEGTECFWFESISVMARPELLYERIVTEKETALFPVRRIAEGFLEDGKLRVTFTRVGQGVLGRALSRALDASQSNAISERLRRVDIIWECAPAQ